MTSSGTFVSLTHSEPFSLHSVLPIHSIHPFDDVNFPPRKIGKRSTASKTQTQKPSYHITLLGLI